MLLTVPPIAKYRQIYGTIIWFPRPRRARACTYIIATCHASYSTTKSTTKNDKQGPLRAIGTWYVSKPSESHQDDVLASLAKLLSTSRTQVPTSALFLATPGLASWFVNEQLFLQKAINSISPLSSSLPSHPFRSIVAIVDALPSPMAFNAHTNRTTPSAGLEGVTICLLPESPLTTPSTRSTQDHHALIDFESLPENESNGERWIVSATLPTANTLFVNGSRSTMLEQNWVREGDGDRGRWVPKGPTVDLKHLTVPTTRSTSDFADYRLPLEAITTKRKIVSSMGNVLRELQGDDGTILKGSTELEEKVPIFLRRNAAKDPTGVVQVYALITPPNTNRCESGVNSAETADPGTTMPATFIEQAICGGGRLLRVTGGGGGWGKKQGLLSLDSALNFSGSQGEEASMFPAFEDEALGASPAESTELLRTGHTVQFFATWVGSSSSNNDRTSSGNQDQSALSSSDAQDRSGSTTPDCILGTTVADEVPSTVESFDTSNQGTSQVSVHPGKFGMLSSAGLGLARERVFSSSKSGVSHEFRIDVPHSILRIR